jgi:hypothetical protein
VRHAIRFGIVAAVVCLGAGNAVARKPGEPVGINQRVEGKTYGEWGGEWWAWAYALPYSKSFANFDATISAGADCSLYQDPGSKVWFLGGNFIGGGTNMQRSCIVPPDKYLFFPLLNYAADNGGVPNTQAFTNKQLKDYVSSYVDTMDTGALIATLDGTAIGNLSDYKIDITKFKYLTPESTDSLYYAEGYTSFWGVVNPSFNGGYYLMLAPLKPGLHTLSFGGATTQCQSGLGTAGCFSLEVTYNLTVLESDADQDKEKKGSSDNDLDDSRPAVPDAIKVPDGYSVYFSVFASGTQNYTCSAGTWSAAVPEATLYEGADVTSPVFGSHFAGPEWFAGDSSYVIGDKPNIIKTVWDPTAIPWLLVPVASTSSQGTLANVAFVQRINTVGGLETGTCDSSNDGAVDKVPYTANYYFFVKQ